MTQNQIPIKIDHIHLVAVCGTGMGALACMLKDLGYHVTGSDQKVYPPMSTFLASKGVEILDGFKAANLDPAPDLTIIGNAVRRDNPEAQVVMAGNMPYCSMPQALNHFAAAGKQTLMVTGTHGKTTTSSLLAWVLQTAGLDPTFMIGGILKNFGGNYRLGQGPYFVVEGDEYDTAFFDKGSKFLHFNPLATILTSVEFDHADIFQDLDHVKQAFTAMIRRISPQNRLVAYDADTVISGLVQDRECRVERYGRLADSEWRLGEVRIASPDSIFEVHHLGRLFGRFQAGLMGEHNLLNALAVIAVAHGLGISREVIAEALGSFKGIKRRQEIRGRESGITVMDDFAHHPTAVRETLRAVKPFYPGGRLIAVFEPRTNTSMRKVFQDIYPACFDTADLICIRQPPLLEKVPQDNRFSSVQLVADLKNRGLDAHFFEDTPAIIDFLIREAQSGDLVLIMSNGGFDNIHENLLKKLENQI